jgi:hypothetical protein
MQAGATECPKCGIVFEKYHHLHEHSSAVVSAPPVSGAAPAAGGTVLALKVVFAMAALAFGLYGRKALNRLVVEGVRKATVSQPARDPVADAARAKLLEPLKDENGFVPMPAAPAGQVADTVYVVAAENCPLEDAQRANRLTEDLARAGVRVLRTSQAQFNFSASSPGELAHMQEVTAAVMNGPLPVVLFHGRATSNPKLGDVLAEYHASHQ